VDSSFNIALCSAFVILIFACEWAVFGDSFEQFERPDLEEDNWWNEIPILGAIIDSVRGIGDALSLVLRLLTFDVPSLQTILGGWLRWILAVPVWTMLTYIVVSVVWIG